MQLLPIRHSRHRFSYPNIEKWRISLIITLWWWISLETRVEQTILQKEGGLNLFLSVDCVDSTLHSLLPFNALPPPCTQVSEPRAEGIFYCGRSFLPPSLLVSLLPCLCQPRSLCSLSSTFSPLTMQGPHQATCTLEKITKFPAPFISIQADGLVFLHENFPCLQMWGLNYATCFVAWEPSRSLDSQVSG